jgi:uncharacterized membrane protein AbrB (regulator of aidB expression)
MKSFAALLLLTVLVALGRFLVPGHNATLPGTYEAFAHIWVGVLIGVSITRRDLRSLSIGLMVILTIQETVMFLHRAQGAQ